MEKNNTALDLRQLLLEGIKSVIEDRAPSTIAVPDTDEARAVAAAQEAIGWTELWKGRLSNEWSKMQQKHLGAFDRKKNGQTWTITMAQTILEGWLDLWECRNGERHGRDAQTRAEAQRQQALRELELLYAWKGHVMPRHDWILAKPIEQRQQLKTYNLRVLINSYRPILEESYKERLATG